MRTSLLQDSLRVWHGITCPKKSLIWWHKGTENARRRGHVSCPQRFWSKSFNYWNIQWNKTKFFFFLLGEVYSVKKKHIGEKNYYPLLVKQTHNFCCGQDKTLRTGQNLSIFMTYLWNFIRQTEQLLSSTGSVIKAVEMPVMDNRDRYIFKLPLPVQE